MGITAFAATEKIDTVKLSFTCDPVPKAGEAPGTVTAKTSSREFTVKSAYSGENTVTERQVSDNGNGSWIQNQHGWWYRYYDGGYPSNTWEKNQ